MHEISICQGIIDSLEAELEEEQYAQVREIHVKVGVLSCIDAPTLEHVFSFVADGSPFHKASLLTTLVDIRATCEKCGLSFKVDHYRFICPACESPTSQINEGRDLTIFKIILEEPSYAEINE